MKTTRKKPTLSRCFEKPTIFRFAFVVLLAGCAAGAPAPGTSPFALMGDTPYSERDVPRLDSLIDDLNAQKLAFVVHIGDITSGQGPCSDAWLEARKKQFARIAHPFILLPGDNDWTDCHRGGFDPMERLARWRAPLLLSRKVVRRTENPSRAAGRRLLRARALGA